MSWKTYEQYRHLLNQKIIVNVIESFNIDINLLQIQRIDFSQLYTKILKRPQDEYNFFIADPRKRLNNFLLWIQMNEERKLVIYLNEKILCFTQKHNVVYHEFKYLFKVIRELSVFQLLQRDIYQCYTCNERFSTSDDLKKHLLLHEEIRQKATYSDHLTLDLRRTDYCIFNIGCCKCKNHFFDPDVCFGFKSATLMQNYTFSNQFVLTQEGRCEKYRELDIPFLNIEKDIFRNSMCQILTKALYDFEEHHLRYEAFVAIDGDFIQNIEVKSKRNKISQDVYLTEHKLNVIEFISNMERENVEQHNNYYDQMDSIKEIVRELKNL
mgnify:CR=1 FL=1